MTGFRAYGSQMSFQQPLFRLLEICKCPDIYTSILSRIECKFVLWWIKLLWSAFVSLQRSVINSICCDTSRSGPMPVNLAAR